MSITPIHTHSGDLPVSRTEGIFPRQVDSIGQSANAMFITVVIVGFFAFFTWASLTSIDKVTRASGRVIPIEQNQNIQHMEGGIISQILVQEGEHVEKGDVLVKVENSFNLAELEQIKLELLAQRVRMARLDAEARGLDNFVLDNMVPQPGADLVNSETQIFNRRKANLEEQLLIVTDQARQQSLGLSERETRLINKRREYELMEQTVQSLRGLVQSGAASRNSLLDRETQLQKIQTQLDDLEYQIPQFRSGLSEFIRRRNEIELEFRSRAENDRAEAQNTIAKLEETIAAMFDRSRRTNVVAPISGRINRLLVSTVGGVVQPGQTLAQIVPANQSIAIEARVSPKNRADIYPGLNAIIKISAYDYSIYGALEGSIVEISPDALKDENGQPYFRVRIEADAQSFGPNEPVVPGMLAEVNVLTGANTVLDFILQPIRRIKENAFRQ
ncbi:MAG TPA: HlyD family type I secretion periplasmic adaptor subunit [Devosia sp.]|nr:HlyD family type I secretion periplasmic adaptor subunit [Devosia sp.]